MFNILCGNTDDHARNHAAFWDGKHLTLTPAYDICPQSRAGNAASQAMLIVDDKRTSTLATCLAAAPNFLLDRSAAEEIIVRQVKALRAGWDKTCADAALNALERTLFRQRIFLNPFIFEGMPEHLHKN